MTSILQEYRLRAIVKKYSDYIRYPVRMPVEKSRMVEGSDKDADGKDKTPEYETYTEVRLSTAWCPIWKKKKSEVDEGEYNRFYKEKFYDFEDPLRVITSSTEGLATYNALLFIPVPRALQLLQPGL